MAGTTAHAGIIAAWTFDAGGNVGQMTTPATGTDSGHVAASTGAGPGVFADGHHANSSTQWSAGSGGNPGTAFLTQFWTIGDYWEFNVNTTGLTSLQITFDQMGSGNGPRDFKVQTSTDGSTWLDLSGGSYSLPFAVWKSEGAFSIPDHVVGIRLVDASGTGVQGIGVTTTGRDFVDNFVLTGVTATPEPSSWVLSALGLAGMGLLQRRRARESRWGF